MKRRARNEKIKGVRGVDRRVLTYITSGGLVRRRGGWRFGTRRIGDVVVDRLVAGGRAVIEGDRVKPATSQPAE